LLLPAHPAAFSCRTFTRASARKNEWDQAKSVWKSVQGRWRGWGAVRRRLFVREGEQAGGQVGGVILGEGWTDSVQADRWS